MKIKRSVAFCVFMVLVISFFMVMSVGATTVATGKFTTAASDARTSRTIATGLTNILVLRIYVYDPPRPAEIACTSDQLQTDRPGAFICQTKWLNGIRIVGGTFTVSHAMFFRPGVTYYWEALGN